MTRWPVIRHLRWLYLNWRINRWMDKGGRYYWLTINPLDEQYLEDVWEGNA